MVSLSQIEPPFLGGVAEEVGVGGVAWPHLPDYRFVLVGVEDKHALFQSVVISSVTRYIRYTRVLKSCALCRCSESVSQNSVRNN